MRHGWKVIFLAALLSCVQSISAQDVSADATFFRQQIGPILVGHCLDHERLTYYHNGLNRRLTDVHGNVIREILTR